MSSFGDGKHEMPVGDLLWGLVTPWKNLDGTHRSPKTRVINIAYPELQVSPIVSDTPPTTSLQISATHLQNVQWSVHSFKTEKSWSSEITNQDAGCCEWVEQHHL